MKIIKNILLHRTIRQKDVSKFHVQLALALILDDLFSALVKDSFIKFNHRDCIAVNSLYYYIFMVVQMWTGAEALLLLQKLFFVFKKTTACFIITVSVVCWGEYNITLGYSCCCFQLVVVFLT